MFAINGDSDTPQPHNVEHPARQEGTRMPDGGTRVQGKRQVIWQYEVLAITGYQKLWGLYTGALASGYLVSATNDDDTGAEVISMMYMHEPDPGTREGAYYYGSSVTFIEQNSTWKAITRDS